MLFHTWVLFLVPLPFSPLPCHCLLISEDSAITSFEKSSLIPPPAQACLVASPQLCLSCLCFFVHMVPWWSLCGSAAPMDSKLLQSMVYVNVELKTASQYMFSEQSWAEQSRLADNLWSLDYAASKTAKGNISSSPVLHDHFRTQLNTHLISVQSPVCRHSLHFPFSFGFLPVRITQSPVLLLPPPPPPALYLQLWKAMNKERQLALQDPVTDSIRAYLSMSPAELHFLDNGNAKSALILSHTEKYRPQRPERACEAPSDLLHPMGTQWITHRQTCLWEASTIGSLFVIPGQILHFFAALFLHF